MKKITLLTFAIVAMVACKNDRKTENQSVITEENPVTEISKKPVLEIGCYEYNNNGSHVNMEITEVGENVTGDLNIAYAEKDDNHGAFVGKLHGDKLLGTYTFNAEGKESSREMAFLVKDSQLIEGYGDLTEDGTKFKDPATINYNSSMPLTRVDCNK